MITICPGSSEPFYIVSYYESLLLGHTVGPAASGEVVASIEHRLPPSHLESHYFIDKYYIFIYIDI